MILPQHIQYCLQALEDAGYCAYVVGGCVRDHLLGNSPSDFDLCTDAAPQEISRVFADYDQVKAGMKHGTVGVIFSKDVVEITTFRTEGGYGDNRHPDWVRFVDSLREDLARRDFTVNAMAYSPKEGFIDPFGGQEDLQKGILRAVGEPEVRFTEDALRILRGMRFAIRFHLTPDPKTQEAMFRLAPLMDKLARERVFSELCKLLPLASAEDLIRFASIITQVIPELKAAVGFCQNSPHHAYDVYTHTAYVAETVPADLSLRWAALLHDVAKPEAYTEDENGRGHFKGHAQLGAAKANEILLRLKAPTALRERVVFLIKQHMVTFAPDKKLLRHWMGKWGVEATCQLFQLQKADFSSKGTGTVQESAHFTEIEACMEQVLAEAACLTIKDLAITGRDLQALGMKPGPEMGRLLESLLTKVQNEELPNEKPALLAAAQER